MLNFNEPIFIQSTYTCPREIRKFKISYITNIIGERNFVQRKKLSYLRMKDLTTSLTMWTTGGSFGLCSPRLMGKKDMSIAISQTVSMLAHAIFFVTHLPYLYT